MTETQVWSLIASTLDRLERKVDEALSAFNGRLDAKADKDEVLRLDKAIGDQRVATEKKINDQRVAVEKRMIALERNESSGKGIVEWFGRFWVACSAAAGLGALIVYGIQQLAH